MGPEFEKGDGRLRPSLQQRLPGAEGPPGGMLNRSFHAACGGPFKERKKTDNPREGWEDGTPPPHRDFKERCVVR